MELRQLEYFVAVAEHPELVMPTAPAVAADATSRTVAPLLRACSAAEQLAPIDQ